jgi:Xaa-Pro aminopeptidase
MDKIITAIRRLDLEKVLIEDPAHIYYLTGLSFLFPGVKNHALLLLERNGENTLVVSEGLSKTADGKANKVVSVAHPTTKGPFVRNLLFEKALGGDVAALQKTEAVIDPEIRRLRRVKDAGEISILKNIGLLAATGYDAIGKTCSARASELDLLLAAKSACAGKLGRDLFVSGDFVSGERTLSIGGEATARKLAKSENVIVDLWLVSDHYWNDSCRTFFVGSDIPKEKKRIISILETIHASARRIAKPGIKGVDIYTYVQDELQKNGLPRCPHHIGHGIGLDFWEPPFITADSDDTIEEGMVFTIEIGVYGEELGGGYRIEHVYAATTNGNTRII